MDIQSIHPRNIKDIVVELVRLGIGPGKLETMTSRSLFQVLRVSGVSRACARALKGEMLVAGGDAAMPLSDYDGPPDGVCDVILMGTLDSYEKCLEETGALSPELESVRLQIKKVLMHVEGSVSPPPVEWSDGPMTFGERTYVMGIINCTPDSFYDGGRNLAMDKALKSAREMIEAGVDVIDVGGESTRPGAAPVEFDEEIARTVPFIKELKKEFPDARVSIDTYKARVASDALEAGAGMINDVSALRTDPGLARVAADSGVPVCLMHMRKTPSDMQSNPEYPVDVCYEINTFLRKRIDFAVEAGVRESQIIVDPGIGFGKTVDHNLEILCRVSEFRSRGRPLLIGASRKSFIGATLDLEPDDRLEGSLSAAVLSVVGGADIIRAHDVKETIRAVSLADAVTRKKRILQR